MHPVEQPGSAVGLCPAASNRINTIFMSTYFAGGTLGTFLSGAAWAHFGWPGVVAAGALLPPPRCRSRSSAENSSGIRAARSAAVFRRTPGFLTTDRRRFLHTPAASCSAFAAASGCCPANPALAPVSARECRPRFPRTERSSCLHEADTSVLSHEFPVFTPMLRRPICLPPSGNAAWPLRNRKPNRFRTCLPLHRTLPAPISPPIPRTPRSDVAPEGPNYLKRPPKIQQFYLSIN